MSPQRREADGRRQTAHSWESLVERQIRMGNGPSNAPQRRDGAAELGRLERAFGDG